MYKHDILREIAERARIIPGPPCYDWSLNSYISALNSHPKITRLPNKWVTLADKVFLLAEGWNQECQRYLFLKTLITHPKHRRMGYAKEMLKIVKEVAHEDGFHDEIILVPAACEWITQPEQIDWSREVTPLQVHDGTHPCPNAPLTDKQLENIYLNEGWRPNVVNHLFVIENSAFGNQSLSECPISEYGKRKGRRILAWRADFDRE